MIPKTKIPLIRSSKTGVSFGGVRGAKGEKGDQGPATVNHAGQVRVNYATLTLTNFDDTVNQEFNIGSGTPTLSNPPTTIWPIGDGTDYDPGFYDADNTRLKENPIPGQVHTWRLDGSFTGKGAGNNGALVLEVFNPNSGFTNTQVVTLPSSTTAESFTVNLLTIADQESIPSGRGYRIRARTSFNDANLTVRINSITRISSSTENTPA